MIKGVVGYENLYEVSTDGVVYSLYKEVELPNGGFRIQPRKSLIKVINSYGYEIVTLYKNKKPKTFTVHRLVALAFIPNPDKKSTVNHIDGNKLNNSVSNLEWATPTENNIHAYKNNLLINKGEKHGRSKLTAPEVRLIKLEKEKFNLTNLELSKKYKVSVSTIQKITQGVLWKHLIN